MGPLVFVVIGVSGSGKTTVGKLLAQRLDASFADADDFHSAANKAKMHAGIPLDDDDRKPWLAAIAAQIDRWRAAGQRGIVTCSALKQAYRETIVGGRPDVLMVYLKGDRDLIAQRLAKRHGHFMPASLLDSQFATLEEPTSDQGVLIVGIDKPPEAIVEDIIADLDADPRRR